jgi:hypothetical protein
MAWKGAGAWLIFSQSRHVNSHGNLQVKGCISALHEGTASIDMIDFRES